MGKRLGFIRSEIQRVEGTLKELQLKGQKIQSEIIALTNEPVKMEGT